MKTTELFDVDASTHSLERRESASSLSTGLDISDLLLSRLQLPPDQWRLANAQKSGACIRARFQAHFIFGFVFSAKR
jgi:hypothetical protein